MARRNKKKIFSIILTNHGKQLKTIFSDTTEKKIYKKLDELLKENKKVVFPMEWNNHYHHIIETDYELVIIKCKDIGDKDVNKVKNDYGEYVDYESSDEDWIVIDRARYNIEETFWVYGYHPKLQRKDFQWIYDNFILKDSKDKYKFKSVALYLNKILIECEGKLDLIMCKNKSDSIRFFNQLEEFAKKDKLKYVMFIGDISHSKHKNDWVDKIRNLTHWNDIKIKRPSTRP